MRQFMKHVTIQKLLIQEKKILDPYQTLKVRTPE